MGKVIKFENPTEVQELFEKLKQLNGTLVNIRHLIDQHDILSNGDAKKELLAQLGYVSTFSGHLVGKIRASKVLGTGILEEAMVFKDGFEKFKESVEVGNFDNTQQLKFQFNNVLKKYNIVLKSLRAKHSKFEELNELKAA